MDGPSAFALRHLPSRQYAGLHQWRIRAFQEGSKQADVFAIGIVFSVIGALVISMRMYVRIVLIKAVGADDWLMLAGTICNIGLSVANMVCAWYGAGVHMDDIPLENFEALLKSNYANRLLYVAALCLVKMSILVFYLRIDHRAITRWTVYALMFSVIGLNVATFGICAFSCSPVSLFWDTTGTGAGTCMKLEDRQVFFEANGIINIVQDVLMYLLPIPILWQLQVPKRQKMGLVFIFSLGMVSVVAGGVRYNYVLKLANEQDIWYYFADSLSWCSIEVYVAIICGSASTFKIIIQRHLPGLLSGSSRSKSSRPMHGANAGYDQSRSGQFALETFGGSNSNKKASSKRGLHDVTIPDSGSEEAIVKGRKSQYQVGIKTEISQYTSERTESRLGHDTFYRP